MIIELDMGREINMISDDKYISDDQINHLLLIHMSIYLSEGFPIKDARLLKYLKSIFHIILPSLTSLSRSKLIINFEKRASFFMETVYAVFSTHTRK